MHRTRGIEDWVPVIGVGMLGVVVGHSLTYLLAVPALVRSSVLATAGHAYWANAVSAGLLAGLGALGGMAVRHFRAGLQGGRRQPIGYQAGVLRLGALQVFIFSLLEICERAAAGVPVSSMFHQHIFPLGVAVQVLVAVVGGLVLVWLARVAEALGALCSRQRRPQRASGVAPATYGDPLPQAARPGPHPPRGPPLLLGLDL